MLRHDLCTSKSCRFFMVSTEIFWKGNVMAEDFETLDDALDADAAGQTDLGESQDAGAQDGGQGTTDPEAHPFGETPADPNDPQYKHWQAAYTKTRQRDRQRYPCAPRFVPAAAQPRLQTACLPLAGRP